MEQYIKEFLNKLSETLTENDLALILEDTDETINLFDEKYFDTYIYDEISPLYLMKSSKKISKKQGIIKQMMVNS